MLAVGVVPLSQASVDAAPYGLGLAPKPGAIGRVRNRVLNLLVQKVVFRQTQRLADETMVALGRPRLNEFVLDQSRIFDRFLQLSPSEFEYPRSDLSLFLPYDVLFPKADVFITNAGFGGTQYALSHGVPLITAGDTEDKPEVSMRAEYIGVGVNLKTGTPKAAARADMGRRAAAGSLGRVGKLRLS